MKKYLILAITLLLATTLTLTACGKERGLSSTPALTHAVTSNGGTAVVKGDYLYFVNGHNTVALNAGDNDWGDHNYGGIYRTKLSNNAVEYDEDGFVKNAELVVPKLVGNDNVKFYIYGDYIYYTSPNNNKDGKGNSLTTLTDYFRVKLNGTENKLIYTSATENLTSGDWTIYVLVQEHYLVVKDGSNLVSFKTSSSKIGKKVVMATDVASVAFLEYQNFYENKRAVQDGYNNYIYYTRSATESDNLPAAITGNILAKVKVGTNQEIKVFNASGSTNYTLTAIKNNAIYYHKSDQNSSITTLMFKSDINGQAVAQAKQITFASYSSVHILSADTPHVTDYALAYDGETLFLLEGVSVPKIIVSGSITVLSVVGDSVIYHDSTSGSLVNIPNVKDATPTLRTLNINEKTLKTSSEKLVDFDGTNLYMFAAYTSENGTENNYLNRLVLTDSEPQMRFVGKFNTDHTPAKPDNTDLPEDEWKQWII